MAGRGNWELVRLGIEFKFAGLILFAGLPLLAASLWFSDSDLRWLFLGLVVAAIPDFTGRCMCLFAPIEKRLTIALSVVFQVFAFVAIATFGYTGGVVEVIVGVVVSGSLQLGAAALFTQFLRTAGMELGCPEVTKRADILNWRLVYSLIASSGLGFAALFAAVIVLIIAFVTCGVGIYFATPVAAAVLLPLVLLTAGVIMSMYWAYGSTMHRLRTAILRRRKTSIPYVGNPEGAAQNRMNDPAAPSS